MRDTLLKSLLFALPFLLPLLSAGLRSRLEAAFVQVEITLRRRERLLQYLVFALFLILTTILLLRHETAHDEVQAWLIARDAPSLKAIFALMGYEGSGALWHLVLRPFARAGLPYETIYVINGLFAAAAVALLLFRAPLPLWLRLLLPFTYAFLFEYPVFARNYSISLALLFAAALAYRQKPDRWWAWSLLLVLAANCNLIATMVVGSFALLVFLRKRNRGTWPGLVVTGIGILVAMLQSRPPRDMYNVAQFKPEKLELITKDITAAGAASPVVLLAFIILVADCLRDRAARLAFLAGQGVLLVFFLFVTGETRHHLFFFASVLLFLWLAEVRWKLQLRLFFVVLSGSMMVRAGYWIREELRFHKDYPRQMARLIDSVEQRGGPVFIASVPDNTTVTASAFLPGRQFYFPVPDRWGSYVIWDSLRARRPAELQSVAGVAGITRRFPGYRTYLYITTLRLPDDSLQAAGIRRLSAYTRDEENFVVRDYKNYYCYELPAPR